MKILVVDDEVIVARALSRAFASKGHEVTVAHSGEEGLAKWIDFAPDAIMLDVVMPGLTGPEMIAEYKKRESTLTAPVSKTARVVLMTAHSGIKGLAAAKELGADDFIQKPFEDIFSLVARVEKLVGVGK